MTQPINHARKAAYVVSAAIVAGALWIALYGPVEPIPMHFDISGNADRYGSRYELAGVLTLLAVINLIANFLTGRQADSTVGSSRRPLRQGQWVTTTIIAGTAGFIAYSSLGSSALSGVTPLAGAMLFLSLVSLVVGAVLGRMPPNPIIGVRTPWAFKSRLAWDKSNRLAGRLMFWCGLLGLVSVPFALQPAGVIALTVAILFSALLSAYESWRIWRNDPEASAF